MRIGIDASRAFLRRRTGIEEYSYQVIRHFRTVLADESVILYVRKKISVRNGRIQFIIPEIGFDLPEKWQVRGLWAPRFWTQIRLSLEMFFAPTDVLFVPAHTVPLIHPKRTIVTIHGLEYEFSPESYSWYERFYMRLSIRYSVRVASRVVAVSENTKRDLTQLYGVPESKVAVVYEGVDRPGGMSARTPEFPAIDRPYFFFIGRIETRKNILRVIEAFELFKEKTGLPHELLLAGKPGHGYETIAKRIADSPMRGTIREVGYVSEDEKWRWLQGAEVFLFPSLYEGFGLPVIESQLAETPVIAANTSSLPEIAGEGAILVDPSQPREIALALENLTRDPERRADIIEKGIRNSQRFSWEKCCKELVGVIFSSHD